MVYYECSYCSDLIASKPRLTIRSAKQKHCFKKVPSHSAESLVLLPHQVTVEFDHSG